MRCDFLELPLLLKLFDRAKLLGGLDPNGLIGAALLKKLQKIDTETRCIPNEPRSCASCHPSVEMR